MLNIMTTIMDIAFTIVITLLVIIAMIVVTEKDKLGAKIYWFFSTLVMLFVIIFHYIWRVFGEL